jgi:GNAT superfamily N-acetyltransferase
LNDISPAVMEKAECETVADYVAAGRPALGTREFRIGGGAALVMPGELSTVWSRVVALGFDEPVTIDLIERVLEFYREQRIAGALLQLAPQAEPARWPEICASLNLLGGRPPWVKLAGSAQAVADRGRAITRLAPGLRAGPVPHERAREWAAVMQQAMGRADMRPAEMAAATVGRPGWQSFAVFHGNQIVATGSLRVAGNVGHLFGGATLPAARGQGAQSALIAARAEAAREAGCDWLISEAVAEAPGEHNSSLHNLLRAGMSGRYQRPNWTWSAGPP